MNFWIGTDVHTGAMVTVHDYPLRIQIADPGGPATIWQHSAIHRMFIVTSSFLGTALVAALNDGEGDYIVVEAAPQHDIIAGRHLAALREARDYLEREIQLERIWDDTTGDSDAAIARHLRDSIRNRS